LAIVNSDEFARRTVERGGLRLFGPDVKGPYSNVSVTRLSLSAGTMDRVRLRFSGGQVTAQMGSIEAVAPFGEVLWFPDLEFAFMSPPPNAPDSLVVVPDEVAMDWLAGKLEARAAGSTIELRMIAPTGALAVRVVDAVLTELEAIRVRNESSAPFEQVVRPGAARANRAGMATLLLVGALLGVTVGFAVGVSRWLTDQTLRRRLEVEHYLRIPSVAVIPSLRAARAVASSGVPRHQLYQSLCQQLLSPPGGAVSELRSVVITGAHEASGSTTTAAYLATALAERGKRVLLIDCNMYSPELHEAFNTNAEPGLSELLLEKVDMQAAFRQTGRRNLYLLPAGTLPAQPTVLLTSKRFSPMLSSLAMLFDFVIIDAPPMLSSTDASLLAGMTDGVVLVVRAGATTREAAQEAVRQLDVARANVIGAVLNDASGTAG